ncbi:MAG: hypothetical protein FWF79_06130, partial [Defluviitaleaceae bacterium]|nr:hypothetical protein [Defluviitaleaceae bacterium]
MLYSEYEEFRDKFIEPHVKLIRYSLPAIIFETERYGMIFDKFNKRQEIFSDRMKHPTSPLLDRHKIAACICVAICDARPF